MKNKMVGLLIVLTMIGYTCTYGESPKTEVTVSSDSAISSKIADTIEPVKADEAINTVGVADNALEEGELITIDQAVEKGLASSFSMDKIKNQIELAALISKNASENKIDIYNAENDLIEAASQLSAGRSEIYGSLSQLDSAQAALDNGIVAIKDPQTGANVIIPASDPRYTTIKTKVQNELNSNKLKLNSALETFDEKSQAYVEGKSKYDLSLQFAMMGVASKLSTSTLSSLDPKPLADLMVEMADIQDKVASYSKNIYKNKIALQIQNSYYEALKQNKLLKSKEKAMERAKLQYDYASFAYEVGAKSKDDMLFAKTYYDGTTMAYELQMKDYNNAMTELKKNMNISLNTKIRLEEPKINTKTSFDLTQGINSGLRTRLEIKTAEAQVELYQDLKSALKASRYDEDDNEYKEALLLLKKTEIELKDAKLQVECGIHISYDTLAAMEKVIEKAQDLKESAAENVEIAKLKYEVGFGADNALLKNLNLQDLSGTMAEVVAAEENFASIEQKVIEAVNGYNLAQAKYLNDIGILPYK